MKKIIIVISVTLLILSINKSKILIPEEAIRFRIIANSDEIKDQSIKKKIIRSIWEELTFKANDIDSARSYIKDNIPLLENKIDKVLKENNNDTKFNINYGKNYFPKKEYNGVVYPEGEYESLVIELGEGKGHNFWCVLFPPLCLIDEDNNTEYTSLIKEVLNKYK